MIVEHSEMSSNKSELKRAINNYLTAIASAKATQDTSAKHRADNEFLEKLKLIIDRTQLNTETRRFIDVNELNNNNIDALANDVCNFITLNERNRVIDSLRSSNVPERIRYFLDRVKAHGITEQLVENAMIRLEKAIKAKEDAQKNLETCCLEIEQAEYELAGAQEVFKNDIAKKKSAKLAEIEAQEKKLNDELALLAEQKKNL